MSFVTVCLTIMFLTFLHDMWNEFRMEPETDEDEGDFIGKAIFLRDDMQDLRARPLKTRKSNKNTNKEKVVYLKDQ